MAYILLLYRVCMSEELFVSLLSLHPGVYSVATFVPAIHLITVCHPLYSFVSGLVFVHLLVSSL